MKKTLREIWVLLKVSFRESKKDGLASIAASLTYYLALSLAPLFYILLIIGGKIYEREAIQNEVVYYLGRSVGSAPADFFQNILLQSQNNSGNVWANVIGIMLLLYGAINFYLILDKSFRKIYGISLADSRHWIRKFFEKRLVSIFFLLGTAAVLIIMVFLNFAIAAFREYFKSLENISLTNYTLQIFNFLIAFIVIFFLFSVIYKILSDFKIKWRDVMTGASISAFLFIVANVILSIHFKFSTIGSFYGVGGSIILTLIWLYYSSQIFLFGGEIIKVHEKNLKT